MASESICPKCDVCGLEITTGFMAFFCPKANKCEFWPHEKDCSAETELLAWRHWIQTFGPVVEHQCMPLVEQAVKEQQP